MNFPSPGTPGKPAHPEDIQTVDDLLQQFAHLEQQLQTMHEGLIQSHRLATLGTLASVIAHEYNNILTPMLSYCQMALKNPEDAAAMRKAVEKSLAGAERAAHISESMLGFAREEDAQHAAQLNSVVEDALACLGRAPEKDGISFTADVPALQLAIAPLSLQQVFVNLLLNAVEAMRAQRHGAITVTAQKRAELCVIEISDTGPGLPQRVRDQLFEPFVTERHSTTGRHGTGLGLSICQQLVERAGGTIQAESQPDHGTTFRITLPIADALFGAGPMRIEDAA